MSSSSSVSLSSAFINVWFVNLRWYRWFFNVDKIVFIELCVGVHVVLVANLVIVVVAFVVTVIVVVIVVIVMRHVVIFFIVISVVVAEIWGNVRD